MTSAAQITANQSNALHSTGPRTTEGKARVSQNAIRHGLTARNFVIRDEERGEFDALRDSLAAELDPQGAVEAVTFQELFHAAWNLARFRRIEAEVSLGALEDFTDPKTTAVLDRLGRYQARAQRAWFKALTEFRALQTNRALRARELAEDEAAEIPAIADIHELTKQTQSDVKGQALTLAFQMLDYETEVLTQKARRNYEARTQFPAPVDPQS